MENSELLIAAMAEQCRNLILTSDKHDLDLPKELKPKHLLWMCAQIEDHAEVVPATKLHRWIGFVQCGMMANRILDFDGAKAMFDKAKAAYGEVGDDLIDHLDPACGFRVDIGGEG